MPKDVHGGQFNFLRVKDGRTHFARVSVASDPDVEGIRFLASAVSQDPHTPEQWIEAARVGCEKARQVHLARGGDKIGLSVTSLLGAEVDTTFNTVEVASFCAAWKALGHAEKDISIEFDQGWRVRILE